LQQYSRGLRCCVPALLTSSASLLFGRMCTKRISWIVCLEGLTLRPGA
jgi:hypothetical protein